MQDSPAPMSVVSALPQGVHFPRPGHGVGTQSRRRPEQVGLDPEVIPRLRRFVQELPRQPRGKRWALWRHGYLLHVEGDFDKTVDVASLRKTWHAMAVGAAIKQGKIPSLDQKLSVWLPELSGADAEELLADKSG